MQQALREDLAAKSRHKQGFGCRGSGLGVSGFKGVGVQGFWVLGFRVFLRVLGA